MIKQFEKLTKEEQELLLKAPALLAVFVAASDHEITKLEKNEAIKWAHLKTFTAEPLLLRYYKEVEKKFRSYFETFEKQYSPFNDEQKNALKEEINMVNSIISKMDKKFGKALHASLSDYAEHVKKGGHGLLENFIFPIPISGLTE